MRSFAAALTIRSAAPSRCVCACLRFKTMFFQKQKLTKKWANNVRNCSVLRRPLKPFAFVNHPWNIDSFHFVSNTTFEITYRQRERDRLSTSKMQCIDPTRSTLSLRDTQHHQNTIKQREKLTNRVVWRQQQRLCDRCECVSNTLDLLRSSSHRHPFPPTPHININHQTSNQTKTNSINFLKKREILLRIVHELFCWLAMQ